MAPPRLNWAEFGCRLLSMWNRAPLRGALAGLLGAAMVACGGRLGGDDSDRGSGGAPGAGGTAGTGGLEGIGGGGGGELFCASPPVPNLALEVTCSTFVPALAPSEVVFVESRDVAGLRAHRFRSTSDCGFDVVLSLPNLEVLADDAPYEMSTWWVQGSAPLGLLAVVLRRTGDSTPLLAVAADGELTTLNLLLAPLSIAMSGPPCDAAGYLVHPVLLRDDSPLPCEEPAGDDVICHDGAIDYRLLSYLAAPDSGDVPAILGNADLVTPLIW